MSSWLDLAFCYDPDTRRADLVLGEDGDLVLDETPLTPMLVTFGSDRRARADDELPTGITELNAPSSFIERRGWVGDALDANGGRIGVRLWLLDRAKQTELTQLMAAEWLKEGYAWVEVDTGVPAVIAAQWRPEARGILAARVQVDGRELTITRAVA
ncbi:phage GP46 family protein [Azorhizobium doebereinerae]|uniref:phage GP46 family protein n=1 Tax=Azorhizobium doebereinerae TaxID=281091 RepID=UPI00040E7F5F|nr:phage GP46 family protein [Azorhizobium doebereinerae]